MRTRAYPCVFVRIRLRYPAYPVRIRAYPCVSVCVSVRIRCVSVRIRAYPCVSCVSVAYPRILRIRRVSGAYPAYPCVSMCVSVRIHLRILRILCVSICVSVRIRCVSVRIRCVSVTYSRIDSFTSVVSFRPDGAAEAFGGLGWATGTAGGGAERRSEGGSTTSVYRAAMDQPPDRRV